jgi:hypothetical protein
MNLFLQEGALEKIITEAEVVWTPKQIFEVARPAGFSTEIGVIMTALAMRESGGVPDAFNNNTATGDRSYGFWQIDMLQSTVRSVINPLLGVAPDAIDEEAEKQLLIPSMNAKAAFKLYGGIKHNITLAWYVFRGLDDAYQQRFDLHLPAAMAGAFSSPMWN